MSYVLITGASSGIGYDMAEIFAEKKYDLVLVSRSIKKLEEIKGKLEKEHGVKVLCFSTDLSVENSAEKVLDFTKKNTIDIDILVNNAGFGLYGAHVSMDPDEIRSMLHLNIISLTELSYYYGKKMKEKGGGKILNVSSMAAYQPTPYFAAYGASKSFVLNFSEGLAKELEDYNVTVTCLSPGPTDTAFFNTIDEKGSLTSHFDKGSRMSSKKVAEIGVKALFNNKLSVMVGGLNKLRAFSLRFASRSMAAGISKRIMRGEVHRK